jgi:hypoxanthine phosphoribosyltransferase
MSLTRRHVSWTDVGRMVGALLERLPRDYDNILVITRGGMVPACLISERTGIRNILCAAVVFYEGSERKYAAPMFVQFPDDDHVRGRRVLVIDDVWDTGSTIVAVRDRLRKAGAAVDVCVLHYKPAQSRFAGDRPDYFAEQTDGWVVYPWDPELPLP